MTKKQSAANILIGLSVCILAVGASACHDDKGGNAVVPAGQKPVITGMASDASELLAGQYTSVYCEAYDPDGDSLRYAWSADQGVFPAGTQKKAVRWTAPSGPCTAIITCTVSDGRQSASMELGILVKPKP
ncbi:MAG: hypothetical protein GYA46_05065 [candidate division Zixibacteria bacterium]|nr:hypothetical protein [candidate division Zixibacteria bacterium]